MDGKLQSKQKIKNKGFTLIELLVVVAIIGILAAVGVVAYSGYTSGAKKAKCMSDHKTLVKFISNGCMKCQIGQEFKLKMNTGGSNIIEKDRCNLVNIGDGDKLKSWIQHHFKQETLTSGNWCKIDGKPDGQGNCQEAVADGGYMGNGSTIYEHEVHGCNNSNISDCETLVVETNCTSSTYIRDTIKIK